MPNTISTLLLRNLHDVFGEIDPTRRRAAINEIFHEDGVFHEPNGTYRGHDEIHRIAGVIKAQHPDFRYQPIAPPEEVGVEAGSGGCLAHQARNRPTQGLMSSLPATERSLRFISSSTNCPDPARSLG